MHHVKSLLDLDHAIPLLLSLLVGQIQSDLASLAVVGHLCTKQHAFIDLLTVRNLGKLLLTRNFGAVQNRNALTSSCTCLSVSFSNWFPRLVPSAVCSSKSL